jgi:hypothetical protein
VERSAETQNEGICEDDGPNSYKRRQSLKGMRNSIKNPWNAVVKASLEITFTVEIVSAACSAISKEFSLGPPVANTLV